MSTADQREFDDPALKAAIRRCCGGETAPRDLHWKVTALFAAGADTARAPRRAGWRRSPITAIAAAAVILLAVGSVVFQLRSMFPPSSPAGGPPQLPITFVSDMMKTHDGCASLRDHHLIGGNDLDALRTMLSREEGVSVAVASLGEGWQFKGAGLCPVGAVRTAHLLFVKGDDIVSLFSMPVPSMCHQTEGDIFAEKRDEHCIVAFVSGGAMYCLVGSRPHGSITIPQVQALLPKVRASLPGHACAKPPALATARR